MDPARMFKESLTSRPELENSQGQTENAGRLMSSMGSRENSDVQLAAACNGTTSVKWVPLVDSCLVNSAPS
jgi:hypothetical protein